MEKLLKRTMMFVLLGVALLTASCFGPGGEPIPDAPADDAAVLDGDSDFTATLTCEEQGASLEAYLMQGEGGGEIYCKGTVVGGTRPYTATLSVRGVEVSVEPDGKYVFPLMPPGTYLVDYTVRDRNNEIAADDKQITYRWNDAERITVKFIEPAAGAEIGQDSERVFSVEYEVPEMLGNLDLIEDINRFLIEWNFGDGTTLSETVDVRERESSFRHVYAAAGTYAVKVFVTDQQFGMTESTALSVNVTQPGAAITPTLLLQIIEEAATASGAVLTGDPPKVLFSSSLRPRSFMAGLKHSVEGEFQLESDQSHRSRPVRGTYRIAVFDTQENILAAFESAGSPLTSDNYTSAADYSSGTGLLGYVELAESTPLSVQYYLFFEAAGSRLLGASHRSRGVHDMVIDLDGVWVLLKTEVRGPAHPSEEVWSTFVSAATDLAAQLLTTLREKL